MKFWREITIVVLLLIIYLLGKYRPSHKPCEPEIKVVEKVVFKDKVVYKDRVVYRDRVITKPDGTRIEESTRTEEKTREKERKEEKRTEVVVHSKPSKHISLGIDPLSKLRDDEYKMLLGGGLRLGNTPFFLVINPSINLTNPRIDSIFLGLTWEIK